MPEAAYRFTKATAQDIPFLEAMENRIYMHNYIPFLGEKLVTFYLQGGRIRKELEEYIEQCIIMRVNNVPIGFAITIDNTIHEFTIDIEYQHKSYGAKLLSYAENLLFETYETLELQTYKTNVNAVKFYSKHNWIQIPRGLMGSNIATFQKTRPPS